MGGRGYKIEETVSTLYLSMISAYRWQKGGKKKFSLYPPTITQPHGYLWITSQGRGTWQTLHTFISSRLLIMGDGHTSCDWILSLTHGCTDSPAAPSSIRQNKWRSISSQMNKENREREKERLGERENKTRNAVKWIIYKTVGNKFLLAPGPRAGVFHCVMIAGVQGRPAAPFLPLWECWPGWITRGFHKEQE